MRNVWRLLLVLGCAMVCVRTAQANCEYPNWSVVRYYQHHSVCGQPTGPAGLRPCSDWWSLDGECTFECDGTAVCTGDTEERYDTYVAVGASGSCPPACG